MNREQWHIATEAALRTEIERLTLRISCTDAGYEEAKENYVTEIERLRFIERNMLIENERLQAKVNTLQEDVRTLQQLLEVQKIDGSM